MNRLISVTGQNFAVITERSINTGNFIVRHQLRSYCLSHEVAEKIKSRLDPRDARLVTPEDVDPSSDYKGLVILAAGPIANYPALKKFSVPYLACKLPVITMSNSVISWAFCGPAERKMSRVLKVVSSAMTEPCPVVVKLYCSGTITYFPAVVKEFSKPDCKLKLVGTIFDSSPPTLKPRDIINVSRFFVRQNRYSSWFHRMKELSMPLILATINGSRKTAAMERAMYGPFLHHVPQLYVYSKADSIIKTDYVESFIDNQQRHNADVTKHVFNDTLHMLSRLKYPEEYDALLFDFLRKKCSLPV